MYPACSIIPLKFPLFHVRWSISDLKRIRGDRRILSKLKIRFQDVIVSTISRRYSRIISRFFPPLVKKAREGSSFVGASFRAWPSRKYPYPFTSYHSDDLRRRFLPSGATIIAGLNYIASQDRSILSSRSAIRHSDAHEKHRTIIAVLR